MLDEILSNETELEILEHTTDTAGYTDLVFALFDLLGLEFTPRLRDIGDQKLSKINSQLNKRDQLHVLRSWLWFGDGGVLRRRQQEKQEVAGCLNLLTNAVVVWNTVYMQEVIT